MQRLLALRAGGGAPDVGHTRHEGLGRFADLCAGSGLLQRLATPASWVFLQPLASTP
jgi:hypothetical protein